MNIQFLGAAGTVTGSRYLLTHNGKSILVDCGLFQGLKYLRERNWEPFPVPIERIDAIVLTHAHIDHSGYIPVIVRQGFRGPIYCSPGTAELASILLQDSARLQEEDAKHANRSHSSRHNPAPPLYTHGDALRAISQLKPTPFHTSIRIGDLDVVFRHAGHILGASSAYISDGTQSIAFSGDLGRDNDPVVREPEKFAGADYLVVESTYGNRIHGKEDAAEQLATAVTRAIARGGTVVIPAFAVGRAQLFIYYLHLLRQAGLIPDVPIYLDSPMATEVTGLLLKHADELRIPPAEITAMCAAVRFTRDPSESKALDASPKAKIIISASGMATGGRVLFHLQQFAPDARNMIIFGGFQATGTRGSSIVSGSADVKIFGKFVPIRAEVLKLEMLSSHADAEGLIAWMRGTDARRPRRVFITHGEPASSEPFRQLIARNLGWDAVVAQDAQTIELW